MKLQHTLLFQHLSDSEIERVLHCSDAKFLTYKKDQTIITPEDSPEVLYLVLDGTVVIEQFNYLGKTMNVEYRKSGEIFGQDDLFLEKDSFDCFVRTKEASRLLTARKSFFFQTCEKNCEHHSKMIYNMLHVFAKESAKKQFRLQLLTCGELGQRTARYLLEISQGNPMVTLSMNRDELAAYLNTTRPSLSRILSDMQEQNILKISGRKQIKILDFQLLQEVIDGI